MFAKLIAIASTVALLVWMGFFFMGSLPLLILKHDTPLDGRFIRGLFNVYYSAVMVTGLIGALGYQLAGRPVVSCVMAGMALVAYVCRRWVLQQMDLARSAITVGDAAAIGRFRGLHVLGMVLNAAQLAIVCVGMAKFEFI